VQAAGGIVLRRDQPPRVAVVRLSKRDEWVLPKGKLDKGETPRAAARREVLEETGHNVTVREFLGTLVYNSNGRSKIVHYWSMEAGGEQTRALTSDIREVDWLPLPRRRAVVARFRTRLSRNRSAARDVGVAEQGQGGGERSGRQGTGGAQRDGAMRRSGSGRARGRRRAAAEIANGRWRNLAQRMRGWFGRSQP
jgi:8-oxo-dGTP diphosphatase